MIDPPISAHAIAGTDQGAEAQLILASASPRRKELLAALGLAFVVRPADIDEWVPTDLPPADVAPAIARRKGAVARAAHGPQAIVIAADTIVVLDGQILGKPAGGAQAREMLTALSGRTHAVYTGLAVSRATTVLTAGCRTAVTVRDLSPDAIDASIASGTPFDKAGGYAIQDSLLRPVAHFDGCYCNVVGLPLWTLRRLIGQLLPQVPISDPHARYACCHSCPERVPGTA